jgi:integrase
VPRSPSGSRNSGTRPRRRRYIAALKAAGLGERFTRFHDLRHTFASELARAGRPERQIQEWCGHASPAVTRRYLHFAPASATDLVAVDVFGSGAPVAKLTAVAS